MRGAIKKGMSFLDFPYLHSLLGNSRSPSADEIKCPELRHDLSTWVMAEAFDGIFKGLGQRYPELEKQRMKLSFRRPRLFGALRAKEPALRRQVWSEYGEAMLNCAQKQNSPWLRNIVEYLAVVPDWSRLENHVNSGQMSSKLWLLEELSKVKPDLGTVYLLGGWYGALASLIAADPRLKFKKVVNLELDKSSAELSKELNFHLGSGFEAKNLDMMNLKFGSNFEIPDTLVNTSCEHLPNFDSWFESIPQGVFVCLQSNNYFAEPEHCNCVNSLEEFQRQAPLSQTLLAKQMKSPNKKYNRFLLLGFK